MIFYRQVCGRFDGVLIPRFNFGGGEEFHGGYPYWDYKCIGNCGDLRRFFKRREQGFVICNCSSIFAY